MTPQEMYVSDSNLIWTENFPALHAITDPAWLQCVTQAQLKVYGPGTVIFSAGQPCTHYPLVIDGIANVQKISEDGHEITLYHIQPGHNCELTTACLLAGECYQASGITSTRVRVVLIPKKAFLTALSDSDQFRKYIYSTINNGMNELAELVETVAFGPMDQRLAHYLLDAASHQNPIHITHHDLAIELGTAREVVSRLLKTFEHLSWIKIKRGQIEILDHQQLETLLKQHPL